jgi:hypothetical protein
MMLATFEARVRGEARKRGACEEKEGRKRGRLRSERERKRERECEREGES